MEPQTQQKLKVIFLPYPMQGHMIPLVDMARLFAMHGVDVTIITTPSNAITFQKSVDKDFNSDRLIRIHLLQFPAAQVGLPDGVENTASATSIDMLKYIDVGFSILQNRIELVFHDLQPDCIVTDMCYPWTADSAAKLGIPRLFFHSTSYFAVCVLYSIRKHKLHEKVISDTQKFSVPEIPDKMEMTRLELEDWVRNLSDLTKYMEMIQDSESRSFGSLFNSFGELHGDYEEHYKSLMKINAWSLGPVSGWFNKDDEEKTSRGLHSEAFEEMPEWLNWLDSRQNESVLYVSFGSLTKLPSTQLVEIAHGLEDSGHDFIWVVRKKDNDYEGDSFLEAFEQKMRESQRGFIIWNWAPQLLILDHPAIGGIVTHCGWNSILEAVNSGLPMITWPLFAEQFYNEKLVTEVLKIGVSVGVKENKYWTELGEEDVVRREDIVKAVELLMGSEEAVEMRKKARKLSEAAKRSIEVGGSSHANLMKLIDELKSLKISRMTKMVDIEHKYENLISYFNS